MLILWQIVNNIMRGTVDRLSTQMHHLSYISPWKQLDSNRQHQDTIAKNRIYTQIILPAKHYHMQQQKNTSRMRSTSYTVNSNNNFRKGMRRMSQVQEVRGLKYRSLNMVEARKQFRSVGKNIQKKAGQNEPIFIRKTHNNATLNVAQLGQQARKKLEDSTLNNTMYCRKNTKLFNKTNSNFKSQEGQNSSDMSLRVTYKKLSTSALRSLKRKSQHMDLSYKLSCTLNGFIRQQNQI